MASSSFTAGCYEALGDEKVASASESADNKCCIGDEDAVDILMSLREGAMRVGLPSDAVAICDVNDHHTSKESAVWHCSCMLGPLLEEKPHSIPS